MQTVSENWKNVHKQTLLNESYVEVSLDIADPESLADASAQDNGAVYISDTSQVVSEVDKNVVPYCTLEQNSWLLDGSLKAIPESNYGESGYVGDALSNDVCVFSDKTPTITINFSKVFTNLIPGVTITWSTTYDEFADDFWVTAYNGDTIVAQKEVIGNRFVKSLVMMDIINYDRIVIQVKKWCLPYHRARIEEIFVGMNKVYAKSDIFDYSHKQSVDPLSLSLPKTEIKFSVDNIDGKYNPLNEDGMAKYLMERQEIRSRYGLKLNDNTIEWIKGGTFYLSEWYAKQNGLSADFTARDLLEFMSDTYLDLEYYLYTEEERFDEIHTNGRSLYELAESVLSGANLPLNSDGTKKWLIDESLKDIITFAPLPEDTRANCLQLIANAATCVLYQDRTGTLRIEPLPENTGDYMINSFNSYSKSEITLSKPIKGVMVKNYTYEIDGDTGSIKATWKKGGYPKVIPPGAGEVIEIDNPLITTTQQAIDLGYWLYTHLKHRMTLDLSWRADVRLDALDIITNENNYHTNNVRVTEMEFKYNGAFRGTGKGKVI